MTPHRPLPTRLFPQPRQHGLVVGRISRPRGFDTLEEHRQSSSKMTLFPFATQATEQVPGASIEKPRVWVINLAAF